MVGMVVGMVGKGVANDEKERRLQRDREIDGDRVFKSSVKRGRKPATKGKKVEVHGNGNKTSNFNRERFLCFLDVKVCERHQLFGFFCGDEF